MSSSYLLKKRREMRDPNGELTWSVSKFGDPNNALGGWEDHYITPGHTHECHPDYEAIPIGNPYGFMVCKKKKYPNGKGFDSVHNPIDPSQFNGYNKYMADLYRPWRETEIQITDPYGYYDRVVPNESMLHQRDYLAREIRYDGIGVNPLRTPGNRKYMEYGFDYTKNPPYKYDVTQLHQKYPIWKEEQIYRGVPEKELDDFDTVYHDASTVGTW